METSRRMTAPPNRRPTRARDLRDVGQDRRPFCASCGERRAGDRVLGVGVHQDPHRVRHNFDGRVIRDQGARSPSASSREFMRIAAPLPGADQTFLLNLAFFLWSSWPACGLRTPLEVHVGGQPYGGGQAHGGRAAEGDDVKAVRLDSMRSARRRLSLVIAMVPMFARDRRTDGAPPPPAPPVVQHLVLSLHFFSFWFVTLIVTHYIIDIPSSLLGG